MRIHLKREFFGEKEFLLAENRAMKAWAFRYSTGVEAIRVENKKGYFIILPFKGQQIWRIHFCGKDLQMKTMMEEPVPTKEYLKTYGAFLLHCGIAAFGAPQKEDTHPQHGEIPNADYQEAYMDCGEDFIAVGGAFFYDQSFVRNYTFRPECRLYEKESVLRLHMTLENRRSKPMEYMYLCHINFRPVDGAELIYSADYDPEHVKVHKIIGDMSKEQAKKLKNYMEQLEKNPALHHKVGTEGQIYDPEICFAVHYRGDENNRAYSLQYTEEGACYVSHPADVLPVGVRWISRTEDEDAMGMVLPATAEHLGYTRAKKMGQVKLLPAKEKLEWTIEAGYLEAEDALKVKKKIENIKNS